MAKIDALFILLGGLFMGEDRNKKLRTVIIAFVASMGGCAALGYLLDSWMAKTLRTYFFTNGFSRTMLLLVGSCSLCWAIALLTYLVTMPARARQQRAYEQMRTLTGGGISAQEFLAVYDALRQSDFTGIYVLHNVSKDMYYVGQSIKVVDRVRQHLTGHGNGDVYADFKYGDAFTVSTLSLGESGYGSLNDLERDTIAAYDAYRKGYNRTSGNSR